MSVASLPMYDLPEIRPALDALWAGLARPPAREGLPAGPPGRAPGAPAGPALSSPDLLFS